MEAPFRDGQFGMRNHNHLLTNFKGCDGIKTGYYREAGFCITATAKRGGLRMLAVTIGCPVRKGRDAETARLLSTGFSQFNAVNLMATDAPIVQRVPVKNAIDES